MKRHQFITLIGILVFQCTLSAQQETYQRAFSLTFENDMFNKMDWYYTGGLQFVLYHHSLQKSPIDRILMPVRITEKDRSWHSLSLRQELYTPKDLEDDTIRPGDHPYAATLTLSQTRVVNRPEHGIRFTSGLRVGILGPGALGFYAQDIIHRITPSHPPKGWDYQVHNDIILNYDLAVDKEIYHDDITILGIRGSGRLGTLHTDFAGGIWFRMEPGREFFERLGPNPGNSFNLYFQMGGNARFVVYDATLQGGLFNKTSPYVIASDAVNRIIGDINMSFLFEIRRHQLGLHQNLVSSRFEESGFHGWLGINYTYWW